MSTNTHNTRNLSTRSPVKQLADHIEQIALEKPILPGEYRYASLPLCVIDAVFSIGVRYSSTQRVIERFCKHCDWVCFADTRDDRGNGEYSISDLITLFEETSFENMADIVFENRQRTSSKSGILKSEAVLLFCKELSAVGIETFHNFKWESRDLAEAAILGLPGQSSGIAFDYFMMLAGDDNLIKPDRMVQRFVGHALSLKDIPQPRQTAVIVKLAAKELIRRGNLWTPLKLDHAIWKYQSALRNN